MVTREQAESHGHVRMTAMKALRAKCMDCCCGQQAEVRMCTAFKCPLWPYRMGKYPKGWR